MKPKKKYIATTAPAAAQTPLPGPSWMNTSQISAISGAHARTSQMRRRPQRVCVRSCSVPNNGSRKMSNTRAPKKIAATAAPESPRWVTK